MNNLQMSHIRRMLNKSKDKRILEIGCSDDYKFLKEISTDYYGVDYIKPKINIPNFTKQDFNYNIKLPFKDNFFDVVIALDVLEHINLRHLIMKELKRVTKPNAIFIISLPNDFSYQAIWQHIKGVNWVSGNGSDYGHKYLYDLEQINFYLKKHLNILEMNHLYLSGKLERLGFINQILAQRFPRLFSRNVLCKCLKFEKVEN